MPDLQTRFSFTNSVLELERAGYDSMGFSLDCGQICCHECDCAHDVDVVRIAGMIRYENAAGEGHVFPLGCPSCGAKGLLFAGPELRSGGGTDAIAVLVARARSLTRSR